ncbi:MAG: hypothetical protein LBV61_03325 [Burkholderiaceae bacterium]|nr:hypothetical protein [Burkholderiaceae bacterium]
MPTVQALDRNDRRSTHTRTLNKALMHYILQSKNNRVARLKWNDTDGAPRILCH